VKCGNVRNNHPPGAPCLVGSSHAPYLLAAPAIYFPTRSKAVAMRHRVGGKGTVNIFHFFPNHFVNGAAV
jgi:hypothetical protein